MPDGESRIPLEIACADCKGNRCPRCRGRGVVISQQGRQLLFFLEKWLGESREVPLKENSLQEKVLEHAAAKKG